MPCGHDVLQRIEAMRLVRRILEVNPALMPRCIVQSLVAIVEARDDAFAKLALDTLTLLAVQNIKGVAQVNRSFTHLINFDSVTSHFCSVAECARC